ncbi:hypothetical protein ACLOJK_003086 [Asimina triloba]
MERRNQVLAQNDRLCNLPQNVIEAVLVLLPIRDAVRTSILSSQWRYRWTAIPQLVFNKECIPHPLTCPNLNRLHRVNIVNQILLRHRGPIHKFKCSRYLQSCPDIDTWITFLCNDGIKEFTLHCSEGDMHKVPVHLFSCKDLQSLELAKCSVKPPPTFSGLANLKTLVLCQITITSEALEHLLSRCTFLEDLKLEDFQGLTHLKLVCPNAKKITIKGSFQDLCFSTPLLAFADIFLTSSVKAEEEQMRVSNRGNLDRVLGPLIHIQKLVVESYFLQSDEMELDALEEFAWGASCCMLNCLNTMAMVEIRGCKSELMLLEFVLANAPVLRTMIITFKKDLQVHEESEILKRLIRFRRASPQATIIFEDAE